MKTWVALAGVAYFAAAMAQNPYTEGEAGFTREHLSAGRGEWRSRYVEMAHEFAPRQTLYGGFRETERFGLSDSELGAGYYHPLSEKWTALVEGSYSPQHNVLARDSLLGQLSWTGPYGWVLSGGLRRSEYTRTEVNTLSGTAERYWGNFRAAYTFYNGHPEGSGSASAHRLALDYYYGERSHVGLNGTAGREAENVGPPLGVVTSKIRNLTVSGRHWVSPGWALAWELGAQQQGDLYRRQGIRLGFRHRF